jgi:hypothetical protein
MNNDRDIIEKASKILDESLAEELKGQGHYLTGALQNSISHDTVQGSNETSSTGYVLKYGLYMHYGVKPAKIPFNPGSGAKSSKYIDALINYFKLRGLSDKEAKSAAFATAKKHKEEGMPTSGSYTYSNNGRRLAFIKEVEDGKGKKADKVIRTGIDNNVSKTFNKTKSETIS